MSDHGSLEDLGLAADSDGLYDRHRRKGAFVWALGSIGAAAVAGFAVVLIVIGLGRTPAPAPLPGADFALPASQVPDPVTGPVPQIGQDQQHGSGGGIQPVAQTHGTPAPATSTSDPSVRSQVPSGPITDDTLFVPAVGIQARVETSSIVNGELVLPADVDLTTEWDGSAPIDAATGTILVAGHVDNVDQGEGAMYPLHEAQAGDAVYLARGGVVTRWKVVSVESVVKAQLPQSLFVGGRGDRLLKLVTCGGRVVHDSEGRGSYVDNVIVTAVPF